ncbi:phosphoribosylanthranilate isomerase [Clostridium sp. E02]|uniref:phosphoribosylanthranilate isomerase n=1 Tax=Clostridium sp. E02 TaxID=2487134 RepID=UPI0013DD87C8|nr:phosphoribosylanthranilate isomerase [Clostridium sp. E02]
MRINKTKRIKICGLTCKEDIEAVNLWKPDYAGFVFAPGKRQVNAEQAMELSQLIHGGIPVVGVFVHNPIPEIVSLVDKKIITMIQLHGDEDRTYIENLRQRLPSYIPVIKAIRVRKKEDILQSETLPVDYLLFDSYVKDVKGGTGISFDWDFIPLVQKPWFLAGGINQANLLKAMKTDAFCLDVSSSVETNGKKDSEKIKEIIRRIRSESICQKEDLDNTEDNLSPKP